MAKIIVRNSDNKVVYCLEDSQIITMTSDECKFTHTYDDRNTIVLDINSSTHTVYEGVKLCASVQKNNIVGLQFHPEKSGKVGFDILKNFIKN